jgi:hypothetical protein
MATAQTADFFGGGTIAAPNVQAPTDLTAAQLADLQRNANIASIQRAAQSTAINNAAFTRQTAGFTGSPSGSGQIVSNQGISSKAPVMLPGSTSTAPGQYQSTTSGGTAVYTDNAGNLVHQDGSPLTAAEYDQYQQVTKTGKYAPGLAANLAKDPATLGVLAAPYAVLGAGALAGGLATGALAGSAGSAGSAAIAAPYAAGGASAAPLLADTGIGAATGSAAAAGGAGAAGAGAAGTAAGTAAGGAVGGAAGGLAKGIIGGIAGAAGAGLLAAGVANAPGGVQPAPLPPIPDSTQQNIASTQAQGQQYAAAQTAAAQRAQQVASSVGQNVPNYQAQGQQAAGRMAPQITGDTGQGGQNAALAAAQGFQPNTSGIAAIQNAKADTSGATPLSNFQTNQSGINNLNNFQSTNSQQGVQALQNFTNPNAALPGLGAFKADTSGQQNLNQFANQAQAPSVAQALLQSGSDANIRQALALARSARGGPAAVAQAQRVAQSENAATQAQTSGQAAALSATETATHQAQQLQALTSAGQQGQQASLQQFQALQASGQIITDQNAQQLQAKVAAGNILSQEDQQKLSAYQSASTAISQADATRQAALANAGQIKLQGSQINQQGAVAASNAQLTASGQQLQAISTQGQISDQIRNANIDTLKANQSAALQQLNLNDTQVRAFAQIQNDANTAAQNARLNAAQLGLNAEQSVAAVNLAWQQFAQSQLTAAQQLQVQQQGLAQGLLISNNQQQTQQTGQLLGAGGALLAGAGQAISDERAKKDFRPVAGKTMAKALRDSPASEWEYTEPDKPGRTHGRQVGPMAQGLQKSPVFRGAVQKTKDGTLAVDTGRLALAHHGALAHLQKEIDLIKKHRKARAHG